MLYLESYENMGREELVNLLKSKMSEISKLNHEKNKIRKFLDHSFKSDITSIPDSIFDATKEQVDLVFKNKIKDVSVRDQISEKIITWLSQISVLKFNLKDTNYLSKYNPLAIYDYLKNPPDHRLERRYMSTQKQDLQRYFDGNRGVQDFFYHKVLTIDVKAKCVDGKIVVDESSKIDNDLFYTEIDSLFHLFDGLKIKLVIVIDGYHQFNKEKIEIGFTKISDSEFRISDSQFYTHDKKALKTVGGFMIQYVKSIYDEVSDRVINYHPDKYNEMIPGDNYFVDSIMTDKSYKSGCYKFINYKDENTLIFDGFTMKISDNQFHTFCMKMN